MLAMRNILSVLTSGLQAKRRSEGEEGVDLSIYLASRPPGWAGCGDNFSLGGGPIAVDLALI